PLCLRRLSGRYDRTLVSSRSLKLHRLAAERTTLTCATNAGPKARRGASELSERLGGTVALQGIRRAYSSTASARCKNALGIVRPMAFAVLRLMASSNFVGCSMGISFGSLPCKIFCTNLAPCRTEVGPSAPNDIRPPISANARGVEAAGKRYLIARSVTGLIAKLP